MRITRLKLVNFIGIKEGLDLNEIEIKFPKTDNKIIMLLGKNGSGKSTILSQCQPFKDSFDVRKELIIKGKEGRKEIDIETDDSIYKILHVYPSNKTAQCFIEKDGVELNPNGGVRTFDDIINSELGLTKDFFNIGKIGTNTENFIEFTTTERKNYISKFVSSVQKYQDAFDVVSKKFKISKEKLTSVSKSLKKYQDEKIIKNEIKTLTNETKELDKNIAKYNGDIAVLDHNNKKINDSLLKIEYLHLKDLVAAEQKTLNKYLETTKMFEDKIKNISIEMCEKRLKELTARNQQLQHEFDVATTEYNEKMNLSNIYTNDIIKYNLKLHSIESGDVEETANKLEVANKNLNELKEKIKLNLMTPSIKNSKNNISDYLSRFLNFSNFIIGNYKELNTQNNTYGKSYISLFLEDNYQNILDNEILSIKNTIEKQTSELNENTNKLNIKNSNLNKLDILNARPIDCTIDICPFIKDALQYKNLPEEIEKLNKDIIKEEHDLAISKEKAENIDEIKNLYKEFLFYYNALKIDENLVYKTFIKNNDGILEDIIKKPFLKLKSAVETTILNVRTGIDNIREVDSLSDEIKNIEFKYTNIKNSEKTRKYFQDELKKKNTDNLNIKSEIAKLDETIKKINIETSTLRKSISSLNSYVESKSNIARLQKEIKEYTADILKYEKLLKERDTNNNQLSSLKIALDSAISSNEFKQNAIITANTQLGNITLLKNEMKEVSDSYNDLHIVKEALDPRKGIPLIFVKAYLNKTEKIANELLDLAYPGTFEIKFIPSANNFFIQTRIRENIKEDIKDASQGEVALTTISISLALMEQSLGEFNILCLDEIDSSLDADNRESFISILNSQIEKMNLEQVFIISHNNAFDTCAMDLILLPGSHINRSGEFIENKNIIFDADK